MNETYLIDLQLFAEKDPETSDEKNEEALEKNAPEPLKEEKNDPTPEPETPYGEPTTAQLNKINKLARRKLSKDEVFVVHAKFVGDGLLKDRAMKLDESLLKFYMKDAKKGVAFMLDHPWAGFCSKPKAAYNYGRTFDASLTDSPGNPDAPDEKFLLEGDIYIVRGKEKDGISTDEIIKDIEDGTLFDVSIGFGFETAECSICGKSIYECDHCPGEEYEVDGKKQSCYVIAKPPGYLMEVSGVFAGAYPSAGFSEDSPEPTVIEVKNIKDVPKGTKLFHVYSKQYGLQTFKKFEKEPAKLSFDEERAKEIAGANWQSKILDLADEGRILKADLVTDSLEWGVRAMGNSFDHDLYKSLFDKSSIDEIKRYRKQFMDKAKEELPPKRQVSPTQSAISSVPLGAYRKE